MPSLPKESFPVSANNTVKLPVALQERVRLAMEAEGFTVWSEFCRVALTEKCQRTEDHQRVREHTALRRNGESQPRNGKPHR